MREGARSQAEAGAWHAGSQGGIGCAHRTWRGTGRVSLLHVPASTRAARSCIHSPKLWSRVAGSPAQGSWAIRGAEGRALMPYNQAARDWSGGSESNSCVLLPGVRHDAGFLTRPGFAKEHAGCSITCTPHS